MIKPKMSHLPARRREGVDGGLDAVLHRGLIYAPETESPESSA